MSIAVRTHILESMAVQQFVRMVSKGKGLAAEDEHLLSTAEDVVTALIDYFNTLKKENIPLSVVELDEAIRTNLVISPLISKNTRLKNDLTGLLVKINREVYETPKLDYPTLRDRYVKPFASLTAALFVL